MVYIWKVGSFWLNMSHTFIVSLKIIYVTTLLSLFTYYFGLQSFILYSEHRVMFTDEIVDFRQDKPPAIIIAHVPPFKPKNSDIIGSCIKENKHEEKGYAQAVKCINKNLKNKTEISVDLTPEANDNIDTETNSWDKTIMKIGITRRSISGCVLSTKKERELRF